MQNVKIVILTPIKNEEWILEPFLKACSAFADHIVLLFQDTHDASADIAARFPKAITLENTSHEYSENSRITQLLAAARDLEADRLILIALDADEIPVNTPEALAQWDQLRTLEPGTNIHFKKPDLLPGGRHIVDLAEDWMLGFVDDGRDYTANEIHAQRVPVASENAAYDASDIFILHLNLVREQVNRAKRRMYCAIENVKQTKPLYRRLISYNHAIDFTKAGSNKALPENWVPPLSQIGLESEQISEEPPFWQDYEVLKLSKSEGIQRFYMDDIWDNDWETTRQQCLVRGWDEVPVEPIKKPSLVQAAKREIFASLVRSAICLKRSLFR